MSTFGTYLRWLGGKALLADRIQATLFRDAPAPQVYVEPFFGAGSVFFALAANGVLPARCIVSDVNPRLIECHRAVRDHVDEVLRILAGMPWGPEYVAEYVPMRALFNESVQTGPEHAARFIWLNKTCFNGLYRENQSGKLNAHVGLDNKGGPKVLSPPSVEHLRWCAAALQRAELHVGDFEAALSLDFDRPSARVYADPPYVPREVTGSDTFVGYAAGGFGAMDQWRLARRLRQTAAAGAVVVTSNHDLPVVRALYDGFEIEMLSVQRSVSRTAEGRSKVGEVLARAYGCIGGSLPPEPTTSGSTSKKRLTKVSTSNATPSGESPMSRPRPPARANDGARPAIVRELHTNVRAAPGRPRVIPLGRHNVIVGKNGAGKSRVAQSLELVFTKKADDLLQRREVTAAADLLFLLPHDEDRLSVQAVFDEEGPLAGQVAVYTIDTSGKGRKIDHATPNGIGTEWVLPVRRVAEALRKGPEASRAFFLPLVAGATSKDDIQRKIPEFYKNKEDKNLLNEGVLPENVDALVATIETATARAKEEKGRGEGAKAVIKDLSEGLAADPSDSDLQMAQAAVEHARQVLEVSAQHQQQAHSQRQAQMLAEVRGQLVYAEANIDTFAPKPVPLPPEQAATVDLMRRSIDIATTAQANNLPVCPGCGRSADASVYNAWVITLNGYFAQFKAQVDSFDNATARRGQAETIRSDLRTKVANLETLLGSAQQTLDTGVIVPLPIEEARAALDAAQGVHNDLLGKRNQWDTFRRAQGTVAESERQTKWWSEYAEALDAVVAEILDAGVDRFRARVQQYLPADRQFVLALRDGKRSICKVGLEREGEIHLALSGAEEAMVWLALTAAILDVLPGGKPAYALFVLPAEKAWDGETLSAVMKAMSAVPYQIVLTSTVAPKRPPRDWNVIDLDADAKNPPVDPPAEDGAATGGATSGSGTVPGEA